MNLRAKFSCIVVINAVAVLLLVGITFKNSSKLSKVKEYQQVQITTQAELSDALLYLMQMDFTGSYPKIAYREWQDQVKSLTKNYDYLLTSPTKKTFSNELQEKLSNLNTLWQALLTRFAPSSEILEKMQNVKLSIGLQKSIADDGIRESYEKYPTDKAAKSLYEYACELDKEMDGITRNYKSLSKINNETSFEIAEIISSLEKRNKIFNIIFSIIIIAVSAFLIAYITQKILLRIKKLHSLSSSLAQKDFTVEIKEEGRDELRSLMQNISNMKNQLKDFFAAVKSSAALAADSGNEIKEVSGQVTESTYQIDANVGQIANEFDEIAESVKNTLDALEKMGIQVETLVINNSTQTKSVEEMEKALGNVVESLGLINKTAQERTAATQKMQDIMKNGGEKISATSSLLQDVTAQLDEVKSVVTIINSVAHQTNLLSMNAAIEASHAGEAGSGFAVVADEIRNLAEETSENARRISGVVKNIVEAVSQADDASTKAKESFEEVSGNTEEVINSLKEITKEIDGINSEMNQINSKSEDTAISADKINGFCVDLAQKQDLVTKETKNMKALVEETQESLNKIKSETGDILQRVTRVDEISKANTGNMNELENMLKEFKTGES